MLRGWGGKGKCGETVGRVQAGLMSRNGSNADGQSDSSNADGQSGGA